MSKRLLYALILIALSVVVLILNRGSVDVQIPFATIPNALKSIVFLVFLGVGVVIGVLLK